MNAITLLAELAAYGMDAVIHEGELYYVGNFQNLPISLRDELHENFAVIFDSLNPKLIGADNVH